MKVILIIMIFGDFGIISQNEEKEFVKLEIRRRIEIALFKSARIFKSVPETRELLSLGLQ